MLIQIYCDGACSGNPGPGGWGSVIELSGSQIGSSQKIVELGGAQNPSTNNRMEMTALLEALRYLSNAHASDAVQVFTDSSYLINGMSQWLKGWKAKGWKTKEGGEVANQDIWRELDQMAGNFEKSISYQWIKGHSGHAGNERANTIAEYFSKAKECPLYQGAKKDYSIQDLSEVSKYPVYLSWVSGKLERHATWPECEARVKGLKGVKFKKVSHAGEEVDWLATLLKP